MVGFEAVEAEDEAVVKGNEDTGTAQLGALHRSAIAVRSYLTNKFNSFSLILTHNIPSNYESSYFNNDDCFNHLKLSRQS